MVKYTPGTVSFENRPVRCEVGVIGSKKDLFDLLIISDELTTKLSDAGRYYDKPEVSLSGGKQNTVCSIVFKGEYDRYSLASAIKSVLSKYNFANYYGIKLLKGNDNL